MTAFDPTLYLVIGQEFTDGRELSALVAEAVTGGVTLVQLREKQASPAEFLELARAVKRVLASSGVPLIINDNVEVARQSAADGLHIGQSDLPYAEARRLLGSRAIIGLSVETMEQAMAAEPLDVDYLGVSPVFATPTKCDLGEPWGLDRLRRLRAASPHKLVAIGGITAENAPAVLQAGADGVALVSAICSAAEPMEAAARIREMILKSALK